MSQSQSMIEALHLERAGYVAQGLANRVAEVDAVLVALGAVPPAPMIETAVNDGGKSR